MNETTEKPPREVGRALPEGVSALRPGSRIKRRTGVQDDAVSRELATAKVYAFVSVDYPGAAVSITFVDDGTTVGGAAVFDPARHGLERVRHK